jgi:hypothetical protein
MKRQSLLPFASAMAPKKQSAAAAAAAPAVVPTVALMTPAEKKKAQSAMVTILKASVDPQKVSILSLYNSLGRNSPEKSVLLQKWLMDKSCKWSNEYKASRSVSTSTSSQVLDGFGTMFES